MAATLRFFETLMQMLHPFMPFITEELWQHITDRKSGESIMVSTLKITEPQADDNKLCADMEVIKQIVASVRAIRNDKNIAPKKELELQAIGENHYEAYNSIIIKMANLKLLVAVANKTADASSFMVGTNEFAVPIGDLIDIDAEIEKQEKELQHLKGFLIGVQKKLSNANFVSHAPEAVVEKEKKKQSDAQEKIANIEESLKALKAKK